MCSPTNLSMELQFLGMMSFPAMEVTPDGFRLCRHRNAEGTVSAESAV